jgi:hypothetical protein
MAKTEKTEVVVDFANYVHLGSDGNPNRDEAIARFTSQLDSYIANSRDTMDRISNAVHSVFDANRGVRLQMEALLHLSLAQMQATPAELTSLKEQAHTFIKASTDVFKVAKGKGGGVVRLSDVPDTSVK